MNDIVFKIASGKEDMECVKKMRFDIFTTEQGIPHELDADGQDESSIHLLAHQHEVSSPVASGRLTINGQLGVLSRIAVYQQYRGLKLGPQVVEQLEKIAIEKGVKIVSLSPHAYLEKFYATLGYHTVKGETRVGSHTLLTMTKQI
jgi:predicted GNAT family N-acyltransferase